MPGGLLLSTGMLILIHPAYRRLTLDDAGMTRETWRPWQGVIATMLPWKAVEAFAWVEIVQHQRVGWRLKHLDPAMTRAVDPDEVICDGALSMSYGLADDELMALLREMLDRDRSLVRAIPEPGASPLSVDDIEDARPA